MSYTRKCYCSINCTRKTFVTIVIHFLYSLNNNQTYKQTFYYNFFFFVVVFSFSTFLVDFSFSSFFRVAFFFRIRKLVYTVQVLLPILYLITLILYPPKQPPKSKPSPKSPFKIPVVTSPRIRVIILTMHPRSAIIATIHIPMPIGTTWVHPLTVMALRAIGAVVHVLVIRAGAGVVRGAAVAVVVGGGPVGVVVGVGAVASPVACSPVARCAVAGGVVVAGAVAGRAIARGAVACCGTGCVVGVAGGTVGCAGCTVGVVIGVVGHFGLLFVLVVFFFFVFVLILMRKRSRLLGENHSDLFWFPESGDQNKTPNLLSLYILSFVALSTMI